MDLVNFDPKVFEKIDTEYRKFAKGLGIETIYSIPLSALDGDNVVNKSEKTPWFKGATLLDILETVPLATPSADAAFRMVVQYVNRPNLDFRGFAGTIASGTVSVNDKITVLPSNKQVTVKEIVTYDGNLESASSQQAITLTFNEEIDISRGNVLIKSESTITSSTSIQTNIVWMDETKLTLGKNYLLKRGSSTTNATVQNINYRVDVNTQEHTQIDELHLNDIASLNFGLSDVLAFDTYEENRDMGGFILIDKISNNTVAAGMITKSLENETKAQEKPESFEIELNALIRQHFPHWNSDIIE